MKRFVATALMFASISIGIAAEHSSAATFGCAAQTPEPAVRAHHISLSAKGSVPIAAAQNDPLAPRHQTVGSNSPKASTPIATASAASGHRTGGVVTPKGSVPVGPTGCAQ